jgi:nitrous oxidase accessory protein NosD
MRKILILSLLPVLLLLLTVAPALAATLKVGPGQLYTKIEDAITAANGGDTILVMAGTYNTPGGAYWVGKSLIIKGQKGADKTIIDTGANDGFRVIADNVTISGFTVRPGYGALPGGGVAGISIGTQAPGSGITGVKIQNCIIEFYGINIAILNAQGTVLSNNDIRYAYAEGGGAGLGIKMFTYDFSPNDGVADYNILNTIITKNRIYENGQQGIIIVNSAAASYEGTQIMANTFYNNGSQDDQNPPYNLNSMAITIYSTTGTIKVQNNKFLVLANGDSPIDEVSTNPVVVRGGNKTYPKLKGTLGSGSASIDP